MNPKGNKTFVEPLTKRDDIIAIMRELRSEDERRGQAAHVVFAIGIFCGFRIGDILTMRIANVCGTGKTILPCIRLREQKRGAMVERDLTEPLRGILREYIKSLDWSKVKYRSYLFESKRRPGKHYCVAWFNNRLKAAAATCGVDQPVSTHTMRKTFARMEYDLNKGDRAKFATEREALEAVSKMLHHRKVIDTERYICIDRERERQMTEAIGDYLTGII